MDLDPEKKIDREQVKAMVAEGRTINAIYHVRQVLCVGLSEAKAFVEEIVGRPAGQRLPPAGAKITITSFLPDGKVDFTYTMSEQVDPADHLHAVLSNLGLYDGWDAEYAKHRGKAEPEIATGIALVRNATNQTEAQRDRLQAILDAERGIKGLPGWVYVGGPYGSWCLPVPTVGKVGKSMQARVFALCSGRFEVYEVNGPVTLIHKHACTDALDGMERATATLKTMGLLA